MKTSTMICAIGGGLVLGLSTVAPAQNVEQARIENLEQQVAELRQQQQNEWLTERRKEEVKGLVREVLQDAETRASLLESGMHAGHNGDNFFLSSADGGFLMNISGQIQFRFIANFRDEDEDDNVNSVDNTETGFELTRTKIRFDGHIADPRIQYVIQLAVDKASNSVYADEITIGYQLTDSILVRGGETKGPFLREELTSSKYQLAVERSYVSEIFTLDKVQGIFIDWSDPSVMDDMLKASLSINDGLRSGDGSSSVNPFTQLDNFDAQEDDRFTNKTFDDDATDFAITGRLDVRVTGDWAQKNDFTSWPGEDHAVFVGAAFHYEEGETGDTFLNNDFMMWTLDASWEYNGWNVFGSVTGMHTDNEDTTSFTAMDYDIYGFVVQGGYNIPHGDDSFEPFVRYEYIDFDGAFSSDEDELSILTFGVNYYFTKHDAKFTLDLVWAFDEVNVINSTNQGLLLDASDNEDQIVLRSQFQLLF